MNGREEALAAVVLPGEMPENEIVQKVAGPNVAEAARE